MIDYTVNAHELVRLLITLPKDWRVEANTVGNLVVYDKDELYVGFISLRGSPSLELWSDE